MDFHDPKFFDDPQRNRRQMSLGPCRRKFFAVHLCFFLLSSHHFVGTAGAYADLIETDDAIAVALFEIHAYGAVVAAAAAVAVGLAATGVDGVVVDDDDGDVVDADADEGADALDVDDGDDDDDHVDEIVVDAAVDAFVDVVASEHASSSVVASFVVAVAVVAAVVVVGDAFAVELVVFAANAAADLAGPPFDAQVLQQSLVQQRLGLEGPDVQPAEGVVHPET